MMVQIQLIDGLKYCLPDGLSGGWNDASNCDLDVFFNHGGRSYVIDVKLWNLNVV